MIIKKNKIFFKTLEVILEDEKIPQILADKNKYAVITILSYKNLNLGGDFLVRQKKTANIYFENGLERTFGNFSDTTRNEIRKSEKIEGLYFYLHESIDKSIDEIYELYKNFQKSKKFNVIDKADFKKLAVVSAYYKNELISAITFYKSYPYLRIRSIFSKRLGVNAGENYKVIGVSTRRLIYEICKYGVENKFKLLDLASVNFYDPLKAGITQFKMSFGGEVEDEFTYIYKSRTYVKFEKIKRLIKSFWQ